MNVTIYREINNISDACSRPSFPLTWPARTTVYILFIPQTILTIITNIVVLGIFVRNKELRLPRHYYFLNLAVCDLILGTIALPSRLTLDLYGCWPSSPVFCRIYKLLDWVTTSEAGFTMILIAYGRYQMISHGASYSISGAQVMQRVVLSWLFNVALYGPVQFVDYFTGLRLSGARQCSTEFFQIGWLGNALVFANNVIPPLLVVILYSAVFFALRKRHRKKRQIAPVSAVSVVEEEASAREILLKVKLEKQTKAMLLLITSFMLTSCPCGICSIIMFACDSSAATCDSQFLLPVYLFTLYLLYFNSLLNPLLYTHKVPAVRLGFSRLLGRKQNVGIGMSMVEK